MRGSGTSNEDQRDTRANAATVDINRNGRQGGMVTNTPQALGHGHRYTGIHTTTYNDSVPSALPRISYQPAVVPYQEQSTPRDELRESHETGMGPTAASSWAPLSQATQARFWCSICGLCYAQEQGVTRHHRDVHEASLCKYCKRFKWHRRHQLEKHLQEQHPDIDLSAALREATRSRRRATIIKNHRQRRVSPSIENVRLDDIEHRPRLAMPPPLPAATKTTTASLSAMSNVDCYLQPGSAETAIKKFESECASELELLGVTAHNASQLVTGLSMSARRVEAR